MIARSKLVILAFFSLIVMHLDVSGQSGNNIIDSTWFLLKEQLLRRSNLALQFSGLKGEKNPDTILFDELKDAASNLTLLLNSPCKLDSNQIVGIEAANYILVGLIQKSVMFSEDKNNFIPNEEFMNYLMQLTGNENRIRVHMSDFNKAGEDFGRPDLHFKKYWVSMEQQ